MVEVSPASRRSLPFALLAIGVLSVSVSGLIAHRALGEVSPLMLAAWRMAFASLFFLGLQKSRGSGNAATPLSRPALLRLSLAGLALAVHFILWFASLTMTTVSIATLLVCTTPLFTALGQVALGRSSVRGEFWVAFMIAVVGIVLVVKPASSVTAGQVLGATLALGGGAVFAIYLLVIDGLQHLESSRIVAFTYTIAATVLWIAALAFGHPTLHYSAPVWEAIALLAVVPQIIGHTLINDALRFFQAHVVAFSILAEPIIASVLAVYLLHEQVTLVMSWGGILVLVSLGFVLARSGRKAGISDEVGEL